MGAVPVILRQHRGYFADARHRSRVLPPLGLVMVLLAVTLPGCGGDSDNDAGPLVRYVDQRGSTEELPFDDALERFKKEAGFTPLLLPNDLIEPIVLSEIQVLPGPPTGRALPRYLFTFAPSGAGSDPGFEIDLNLDDHRNTGEVGIGGGLNAAAVGSPPVTVYFRTNTGSDLYQFELPGFVYTFTVRGESKLSEETMLGVLDEMLGNRP